MQNFIVWLLLGGIAGWLASLVMRANGQPSTRLNIMVGAVGAFLTGIVFTPLTSLSTANQHNVNLPAMQVALVGTVILLAVVNFLRRDEAY